MHLEPPTDSELKEHCCLERVDIVPGNDETTAFKRRARLQQALWREGKQLPVGSQPYRTKEGKEPRCNGSRIAVDAAYETEANFLNENIRRAVRCRLANPEPHQTLDKDRLYCDLLSSMPLCFNLFGELWNDLILADRAVHTWWPDVPGRVCAVRFEWSPGRSLRGEYLENRSAFDVAFELAMGDGTRGILGVETKYHEHCKAEDPPSDERRDRYKAVAGNAKIMKAGYLEKILGKDLQQIWLDHLLALSMRQQDPKTWTWAGFVLVHPEKNPSFDKAARRYQSLLSDPSTFHISTIESLLAANVLPAATAAAFSERYLW